MLTLRQIRFFLACIASGLVLGVGLTVLGPLASRPIPAPAAIALAPTPTASPPPASPITEEPLGPVDPLLLAQLQSERAAAGQAETEANRPQLLPSPYRGTNRFWYPAMGINHAVGDMACDAPAVPGASLYRWGCAGNGNTYLLSHFWAVLKPLYLGYEAGKLKVGQSVWYADATGQVRHYVVTSWKDVLRGGPNGWAFAASATPVLTIQTCLDVAGTHVLIVRLNLAP